MLTRESIEYTATVVSFTQYFKVSLFAWADGSRDRKLVGTASLSQKIVFFLLSAYLGCEAVYHLCLVLVYYGETDAERVSSYLKMVIHATSRIFGLGFAVILARKLEEAAYLYNQVLVLNRRFTGGLKWQDVSS